ncbi:MAG: nuclease [Mesorhizobium amorphae]|nr:MAG: nuclease [Mesorhizobium amorphae]
MRFVALALAALLLPNSAQAAETIAGRASVIDGDTIEIQGQRIRFNGIDAPESRQTCEDANGQPYRCGAVAADALADWLAQSSPTTCDVSGQDRYKRAIAKCQRADGEDVNSWLVRSGYALDWPRYSRGTYADEQHAAERTKRGIWQGRFELPWEWRRK